MADENKQSTAPWPIPRFHFLVFLGDHGTIAFQEVSGLDTEYDQIEYRSGNNPLFQVNKMPNTKKYSDITLKKGISKGDASVFDYLARVKMNTVVKETVVIQLLDEEDKPLFTWTLQNAFPKKVSGTSMNAKTSEVAIEELVLAHEGLNMTQQ